MNNKIMNNLQQPLLWGSRSSACDFWKDLRKRRPVFLVQPTASSLDPRLLHAETEKLETFRDFAHFSNPEITFIVSIIACFPEEHSFSHRLSISDCLVRAPSIEETSAAEKKRNDTVNIWNKCHLPFLFPLTPLATTGAFLTWDVRGTEGAMGADATGLAKINKKLNPAISFCPSHFWKYCKQYNSGDFLDSYRQ